ncbi:TonB-dependent receptor [Rhodohalobacter sp. 614A]|uniref:TonB-dependent receptor n=1 Tax=Rhodohalobacter sp. 614A TaxID=2908649 RepID=UPI001F45156C|nr:TonB-dependent receptor [Rhodohalobacter sp. 614A]
MKKVAIGIFFFMLLTGLSQIVSAQNTGTIEGRVLTSDGEPAATVNVILEGTQKGTATDRNGEYALRNIEPGSYTVVFSFIGLDTKNLRVTVRAGETVNVDDVILSENTQQLNEAIIVASRLNKFSEKTTDYVARMPIENLSNPQSYTVVTDELMQEQLVTDFPSAFKSITGGGYVATNEGNVTAYLRGFRTDSYVRNGLVSYTRVPIDPQNIERIEVIKGPSSTLFGAYTQNIAGYGGLINRVTKKPLEQERFSASYITGSWELNRFTADYNTSLDEDNKVLFRLNGAVHSENDFRDQGIQRDLMIAPSLTYHVNDRLSINVEAELFKTKRLLYFARGASGAVSGDTWDDLNWDYETAYHGNDLASDMASRVLGGTINYEISDNWSSETKALSSIIDVDADFLRLVMLDDNTLQRNFIQYAPRTAGSVHFQQDFTGIHSFENLENKVVVGASYMKLFDDYQRAVQPGPPFIEYDRVDLSGENPAVPVLSKQAWEQYITDNLSRSWYETSQNTFGLYVSDAVTVADRLTILGGLRYDHFTNQNVVANGVEDDSGYDQDTFSYKLGATYSPLMDQVSIFANYMDGFSNVAPGVNENGDLTNFDAEKATQWEVGTKLQLFGDKLESTISYYNISITNAVLNYGEYSAQEGETLSKGFEIDLIANPFPGFNLVAGYTHNEATIEENVNEELEGNSVTYSPQEVANFWLSHRFIDGSIGGFGIGFGGNYVSEIFINTTNTFGSSDYTTFDGALFYDHSDYRFTLKFNNLTDEHYYNGYGQPQKPFNVQAGVQVTL